LLPVPAFVLHRSHGGIGSTITRMLVEDLRAALAQFQEIADDPTTDEAPV
jgi:hypothetical protein